MREVNANNTMIAAYIFHGVTTWRERREKPKKKQQHLLPVKSSNKRLTLTKKTEWLDCSLMKGQPRNESKINSNTLHFSFLFPLIFFVRASIFHLINFHNFFSQFLIVRHNQVGLFFSIASFYHTLVGEKMYVKISKLKCYHHTIRHFDWL